MLRPFVFLLVAAVAAGLPVVLTVTGSRLVVEHEAGGRYFTADFTVTGDRMVGKLPHSAVPVQVMLQRVR